MAQPSFTRAHIVHAFSDPPLPNGGNLTDAENQGRANNRYRGTPEESPASLLEVEIAKYTGMKYAVAMNSCTSTIKIGLQILKARRVLVPAFTFVAVPSAVVLAGATVVLVNIDENYKVDIGDLRRKAPGCDVLLLSHMRGYISDLDEIRMICRDHGIVMLEDAAHALGSLWRGRKVGSFGKIGCFSMQSNKITPAGEGGVFVTCDEDIAAQAVIMSGAYEDLSRFHLGIRREVFDRYKKTLPVDNLRYTNLPAQMVRREMVGLDERIALYQELHRKLVSKIKQASNVVIFPEGDSREVRVPDSLQFRMRGFSADQMHRFVARVQEAGFPLAGIGVDPDNARHFRNWGFLSPETFAGLEQTDEILDTACDMRLPHTLTDNHLDYLAHTIQVAEREAVA